uniref:Acyltransferase n=1 Tax=Panagrolaimus sp. ES5 TaxID=591445 RepID=A0AC34G3S1_9BILA
MAKINTEAATEEFIANNNVATTDPDPAIIASSNPDSDIIPASDTDPSLITNPANTTINNNDPLAKNLNLEHKKFNVQQHFRETLQLLAVINHVFIWVLLSIMSLWVPFYILFCTPIWWTMVLYAGWYLYDFRSPSKGSRPSNFVRSLKVWKHFADYFPLKVIKTAELSPDSNYILGLKVWKHFADYFPLKVIKTAELSPDSNYILGCHPHGVFSIGAFTALCTEGTNFSQLFPGLQSTILTLNGQFYFPFRREVGIFLGGCEASRESLTYLLSTPGKGRIIGIVVGGAEEALDAAPDTHNIHIKSRRGFCRFALKFGTPLVPSYSFGENDYFHQTHPNPRGSRLRNVQTWIKRKFGFCPPFFSGRGIFTSTGLLPFRKPINTVVGSPISVKQIENPTQEDIDQLHEEYCTQLTTLFDEHKTKYGIPADAKLNMF